MVEKPTNPENSEKFSFKKARKSGFLLVAAYLIAADLILSALIPALNPDWYFMSVSGSNESFCRKVIEYITTYNEPEVLVVGSSLAGVPAMTCDDILVHGKAPYLNLPNMFLHSHYDQATYFEKILGEKTGEKFHVVNLGLAGAVASDYLLILKKALDFNKKPALVVCTIAPAEFLWNDSRGVEQTRIRKAFRSYSWPNNPTWYELAFNKCVREVHWHWDNLNRELAQSRQDLTAYLAEQTHHPADYYTAVNSMKKAEGDDDAAAQSKQAAQSADAALKPSEIGTQSARAAQEGNSPGNGSGVKLESVLKDEALSLAPDVEGFPKKKAKPGQSDLSTLLKPIMGRKTMPVPKRKGNMLDDLALYRKRYSNLDMPLFAQHLNNFEQMLKLCQERGQAIIVVNMPLTDANKEILDAKVAKRYYESIASLTAKYHVPYVDMDTQNTYALDDFYDSVHLNEVGGRKFFAKLSAAISDQVKLNELCAARRSGTL